MSVNTAKANPTPGGIIIVVQQQAGAGWLPLVESESCPLERSGWVADPQIDGPHPSMYRHACTETSKGETVSRWHPWKHKFDAMKRYLGIRGGRGANI